MPKYYFDRLEYLDELIRHRRTGSPSQLAEKFNVSKRTVFEYIEILKSLGAEVEYCRYRETYYYKRQGRFDFHFKLINTLVILLMQFVISLESYLF
ncbi:hypothetical protein Pedsa_0280 [Pseudopedobacter saltans DSM 12145]|uniref:Helix-turn-helix type 11 domain-containing protein n=1 Tax=Pseudopedobacter saltans (strain ATCC 51119 / DSM 12145 / JCM 21818 / CCUG 39354 / LMG 10337 / NBRC 100064 / NCIMB 13643) TaxID=762903 RepID=F0S4A8_PSESL|nr:hypothetical protein Pedsa_0280 [Pseudopedobacter saltans DSM 12145]